ncbi:MAG: aminopeptidase N [Jatrophihabitantaceae bacterium]
MTAGKLTAAEAAARARVVSDVRYQIELDLLGVRLGPTFSSRTVIEFRADQRQRSTFVDLVAEQVHQIVLNGESIDPAAAWVDGRITLPGLRAENELTVLADCAYSTSGEGLHRFIDPIDDEAYLYTQFELPDAQRVFACFDQPDIKATFELTVTTPAGWTVVGNEPTPTAAPSGDAQVHAFTPTPRLSTYLVALVCGPYVSIYDEWIGKQDKKVPLGLFARHSLAERLRAEAPDIFAVTKKGLEFFGECFDFAYPFEKLDQLFLPEFNAYGMENAGAVTLREQDLFRSRVTAREYEERADTVLHELAHMWFGDLVTMTWWNDLWLNESFATFMSRLCLADSPSAPWPDAWTTFADSMKTRAYAFDQLPSTHPIVTPVDTVTDAILNIDGITYEKGASVLRQLVAYVGLDAFLAGVARYMHQHAWSNTTLSDLLSALEASSGRDLQRWSRAWLETAGINSLRAELHGADSHSGDLHGADSHGGDLHGGEDRTVDRLSVTQTAALPTGAGSTGTDSTGSGSTGTGSTGTGSTPGVLRPHRIAVGLYDDLDGTLVRTDRFELDIEAESATIALPAPRRRPALLLPNDGDLTYAKVRLDDSSLAVVRARVGDVGDPLARALCWSILWDMTRDGELAARDYLTTVLGGVADETDIGVVLSLQSQLKLALDQYADPDWREDGLRHYAQRAGELLRAAPPASDHQLAWAQAFVSVAREADQLDDLEALLDRTWLPDGLALDTDLRWDLVHRLVATGRAGADRLDDELARDPSAAGRLRHAAGLAARPSLDAKEEAWAAVVVEGRLGNSLQEAVIGGFVQPDQRELLARFTDCYFDAVAGVFGARSIEMANQIVVGLYPAHQVAPRTLEVTDAWLAREDRDPVLRRLVLDRRAEVDRALRARRVDRAAGPGIPA